MLSDHIPVRHAYLSQLCRLSLLLLVMEDLVLSPFSCFSYCLCYTTRWRTPSLCWAEPGRLHWNSFCCSLQSCVTFLHTLHQWSARCSCCRTTTPSMPCSLQTTARRHCYCNQLRTVSGPGKVLRDVRLRSSWLGL